MDDLSEGRNEVEAGGIIMFRHMHILIMPPFAAASESVALRTTKKKRGRPSQHEEIIKLLESVGARKGSSSKVHPSSIASVGSTSSASHAYSTRYNVRKINTLYYRQVHDAIRGMLKEEEESVDPKKAVEFMKKMRGQEEYRRRCGSRVLCLDGGGIRGLLQMATLREIERQAGMKIVELFDWIVGTSTGGIIALSLTYGGWVSGHTSGAGLGWKPSSSHVQKENLVTLLIPN